MRNVLRTSKVLKKYSAKRRKMGALMDGIDLRTLPKINKTKYWILVENEFPYDKIASKHHLLVPLRKFKYDDEMTAAERDNLFLIKKDFTQEKRYDAILETLGHNRSIPDHYHIHCITFHYVTPVKDLK